ncbi:MAG: HAD hydrolase family protein [Candidatus Omnitrophica bacterium]|nr:HAD hydrolase family protein [Candidatus Omnitrophota bacterium]
MKMKLKCIYKLASCIKLVVFDFDGVFTDNRVLVFEDGSEAVFCHRGDGLGLGLLKKSGLNILVISSETNSVVAARCRKLNLDCIQGCQNKFEVLKEKASQLNISLKEVAYLGNDINDIECLKNVGLAACVRDSHPEIFKYCKYVTSACGGFGAVREFCDIILKAKSTYQKF